MLLLAGQAHAEAGIGAAPGDDFAVGVFEDDGAWFGALDHLVADRFTGSVLDPAPLGGGEFDFDPFELGQEQTRDALLQTGDELFQKALTGILGRLLLPGGQIGEGGFPIQRPLPDEETAAAAAEGHGEKGEEGKAEERFHGITLAGNRDGCQRDARRPGACNRMAFAVFFPRGPRGMKPFLRLLPLILLSFVTAQETPPAPAPVDVVPIGVATEDFTALKGQSPFLRSLNLSDSLVLTGFADVEGERVATIMNRETKQTYVVSSQINSQGWKMVDLKTDADLEKVAAKVAVDGGEVVTVRYANIEVKTGEAKPAPGPSTETNGSPTAIMEARRARFGGPRGPGMGGPPPEIREKMEKLSDDQREKLFNKMRELREKSPDMSWEERGKVFNEALDKMVNKKK